MLQTLRTFLNRPIAEDFRFVNQIWPSLQAGLYVFLFVYFFGGSSVGGHSRALVLALFGIGVVVSTLVANWVVPQLLSTVYDEERWTVGKHSLHVLFILFCVSVGNQLLLILMHNEYPPFWQMYLMVTIIGFFPITIGVFVTEQRRLKRNLAHAQTLNRQLGKLHKPVAISAEPQLPKGILLTSENGREKLSLLPNQLLYIESVGNYVEVHWLNFMFPQKTVLRNTLKEMEQALAEHPQVLRCHRAFIVNLKAISKTEGNARGYQLLLSGSNRKIPVSRGYLDAFNERMNQLT